MFGGFFARGCVAKDRDERLFGGSRQSAVPGHDGVVRESHRNWRIEITHRLVGMVLRREQFNVVIVPNNASREIYLTGFTSRDAALSAARERIDELAISPGMQWHVPQAKSRRRLRRR